MHIQVSQLVPGHTLPTCRAAGTELEDKKAEKMVTIPTVVLVLSSGIESLLLNGPAKIKRTKWIKTKLKFEKTDHRPSPNATPFVNMAHSNIVYFLFINLEPCVHVPFGSCVNEKKTSFFLLNSVKNCFEFTPFIMFVLFFSPQLTFCNESIAKMVHFSLLSYK